jgi:CBS domain-containing protein
VDGGQLIGIITETDIVRAFVTMTAPPPTRKF